MPAPMVAICMPIGDKPDPKTMSSIIDLKTALDTANAEGIAQGRGQMINYTVITLPGLRDISKARNALTQQALNSGADYIMWIDSDMTFSPEAVLRLLSHRRPIVGGLCFGRRPPSYQPVLLRFHAKSRNLDGAPLGFVYDYPPNALFEVDATGGAFLLVQRKVFEQIPVKAGDLWWSEMRGVPGVESEDVSFCVRARRAGFPVYVDTGVRVGHKAEVEIDETIAERLRDGLRHNEWVPENLGSVDGDPWATIVIPTFNTPAKYLHAAIASAREQSVPCEVIVVDDGSTTPDLIPGVDDGSVKLVKHAKNAGISAALNTGFREATTDWICWLSADDLLAPTKVERQLQAMLTVGARAGFHGYSVLVDDEGEWQVPRPPPLYDIDSQRAILAKSCIVNGSTTMIHRSVFEKVGLYDTAYRFSQDWEMWCRIGAQFLWHYLPENLGLRRETRGNLTSRLKHDDLRGKVKAEEDAKIVAAYSPSLADQIEALR